MKKNILLLFLLICAIFNAQKVKFRDNKLIIDDKEVLSYLKTPKINEVTFYKLNTKDELFFIKYDQNGTFNYDGDNFVKLYFAKQDIKIESKSLRYGGVAGSELIKKLVSDGILQTDGTINEEKLNIFYHKFNDYIIK